MKRVSEFPVEMAERETMTRRDFLNGTLLASGAALMSASCPWQLMAAEDWNGPSGAGDYADANGNTHQVMSDGHAIRDHSFDRMPAAVQETGEAYDCVVVGGVASAAFPQRFSISGQPAPGNHAWCSKIIQSLVEKPSATSLTSMANA